MQTASRCVIHSVYAGAVSTLWVQLCKALELFVVKQLVIVLIHSVYAGAV